MSLRSHYLTLKWRLLPRNIRLRRAVERRKSYLREVLKNKPPTS